MKELERYIEIYNNFTEELLVRIKVNIAQGDIKKHISVDIDDPFIFGVYQLSNENLSNLGITNYDEEYLSFFLTSEG
ncbi:hypothetical protein BKK51_08490 [Rodentibacter trehalosifermentans]|uniref:DUF7683 domain-containing protein n=1 Tax=Rodentibacter trehalosifermentans TaxID=1908263 RepID=A0A1V3IT28_9PAST|nr:hypothetical protein [Rodentibacter trehalosifermentans]OOF44701.1 hypothetical protein BKK51_08490 [Rodentibacter trehalosifermentans]OOF45251.1 hypothetical protein BKK52_12730 [Rodentibacter trehalosifermentans]